MLFHALLSFSLPILSMQILARVILYLVNYTWLTYERNICNCIIITLYARLSLFEGPLSGFNVVQRVQVWGSWTSDMEKMFESNVGGSISRLNCTFIFLFNYTYEKGKIVG